MTVNAADARWGADALQHMVDTGQFSGPHGILAEAAIERLRRALADVEQERG